MLCHELHIPSFGAFVVWILVLSAMGAAEDAPVCRWTFDEPGEGVAKDVAASLTDRVVGNDSRVDGVLHSTLCFDGFTTRVVRAAERAPDLTGGFTIEAWIAIRAYPWGWCPIAAQRTDRESGYFLGIDALGHVSLQASVDGQWTVCTSSSRQPLLQWIHVAGVFDPKTGLKVYVNGQRQAQTDCTGPLQMATDVDLLLGRNHGPEPVMFENNGLPAQYSLDGLLDEVAIYNRTLSAADIEAHYRALRCNRKPPLHHAHLPSGPPGRGRFGAFYERLKYHPVWDSQWRSSSPDVVVTFDKGAYRLVCWRGISYAPCWVTEKGNWFTNEFMERGVDRATRGCTESMSDKRAEFSHVKILENNDARAVVYWRHSPVDIYYQQPYVDAETGWGDWAEEYHTIYPDGVAVRRVVMYSNDFDSWHEWCQSIEPLHPGQRPEDVLDGARIVSLANMQGHAEDFGWPDGTKGYKHPTFLGANIQITFLRSKYNPFLVLDDRTGENDAGTDGPAITLVGGEGWSEHSLFPWRNHWPVTQIPIIGRYAVAADRPSHTYTATQYSAAYGRTQHSMTKVMLCGMTERRQARELLPLARSWLHAPVAKCLGDGWDLQGYDQTERAYVVQSREDSNPGPLVLRLDASPTSPLVNPAFVVKGWGDQPASLKLDGRRIPQSKRFRCGYRRSLSSTDLVVWLELSATKACQIQLTPGL